jgi:hypothetical protein
MSGTQFCFKGLGISLISGMDMESAWNEWMETVVSFSHLLSTVNSSINFVIYCYKDDKFREILLKMIRCGSMPGLQDFSGYVRHTKTGKIYYLNDNKIWLHD